VVVAAISGIRCPALAVIVEMVIAVEEGRGGSECIRRGIGEGDCEDVREEEECYGGKVELHFDYGCVVRLCLRVGW
jgi:hypothetical protein